jgi:hypothetical protein
MERQRRRAEVRPGRRPRRSPRPRRRSVRRTPRDTPVRRRCRRSRSRPRRRTANPENRRSGSRRTSPARTRRHVRVVRDVGAVGGRVEDRAHRIRSRPTAVRADELQTHQPHLLADARDPDAVVPDGADRPSDVRAVAVVVGGIVVVVYEIPAAPVVHVAVAVVVDAVRAAVVAVLSRIDPARAGEVGMV